MITVITFYNRHTKEHYVRLHPGIIDGEQKADLLLAMNAVNAGDYDYASYPRDCNILFFQEFEEPDTKGVYFNINGDRPIYDLIQKYTREPEYYI